MFTGLIEEIGSVARVETAGSGLVMAVSAKAVCAGMRVGDSISIDGACQTVTSCTESVFTVFASSVTAGVTTLGSFRPGRRVNLERALTLSSRLGGHIVQGHVDGTATIRAVERDVSGLRITLAVPAGLMRYIAAKGSIAVDGISLTVVSVEDSSVSLYLIPETIGATTFTEKRAGDAVNVETDILAKYVERLLSAGGSGADDADRRIMGKLFEGGFL